MSANTTQCWICGKEYNYCPHCPRYEQWQSNSCSTEHYQINLILGELREGVINESEAKVRFDNIGINEDYDFSQLLPSVARDIQKNIMSVSRRKK